MCPDAVLCRTQAEVDAELDRLGLTMVSVEGDGNCLFRALEEMDSSRTHVEWRAFLVQKIREMAIKDPAFANRCLVSGNDVWRPVGWKQPVDKKNKPIRVPGRYKDFEDLMTEMSKLGEWGFTEFVEVFAEVQDAAFLCFANDGKNPAMVRSSSTSIIKKLFYTWNLLSPATGTFVFCVCAVCVQYIHMCAVCVLCCCCVCCMCPVPIQVVLLCCQMCVLI